MEKQNRVRSTGWRPSAITEESGESYLSPVLDVKATGGSSRSNYCEPRLEFALDQKYRIIAPASKTQISRSEARNPRSQYLGIWRIACVLHSPFAFHPANTFGVLILLLPLLSVLPSYAFLFLHFPSHYPSCARISTTICRIDL